MARITVEDCLTKENNRFALVVLAAQRARDLANGRPPIVECDNKPAVTALREIAANHVTFDRDVTEVVNEYLDERRASGYV